MSLDLQVEQPVTAVVAAPGAAAAEGRSDRWIGIIGPLAIFGLFLLLWEYMHRDGMRRFFDKPDFLVPSPATVFDLSYVDAAVRSQMIRGIGWTAFTAAIGLAIAIVLGIGVAVLMARAQWIERSLYPYLVALQAIPVLAIVPLVSSVFGGGLGSRVFVCVMISIFPIVNNTLFGLTSVEPAQHDLFTLRGVTQRTRLMRLQFPAAMPAIFAGFRISAGLSVIGAVVGEQLFREGERPGLGVIMEQFRQKGRLPELYGALVLACLLGIAVFILFGIISKLVVGHWHEASRKTS